MIDKSKGGLIKEYVFSPGTNPEAVILLVHGLGEHAGRYSFWARRFTETGVEVRSFDLPGHGLSGGRRGTVPSFDRLYDIITGELENAAAERPGVPLFLYGHSLGGSIVLDYLIRRRPGIRGAVVTSPWISLTVPPPALKAMMASLLNHVMPDVTSPSGLKAEHLSHDQNVVRDYVADPLVHDRISFRLFSEATRASEEILARAHEISVPVVILHGRADKITSPSGSVEVASSVPSAILKLWDEGFHELHNEPFKEDHFTFIREWIDTLM